MDLLINLWREKVRVCAHLNQLVSKYNGCIQSVLNYKMLRIGLLMSNRIVRKWTEEVINHDLHDSTQATAGFALFDDTTINFDKLSTNTPRSW